MKKLIVENLYFSYEDEFIFEKLNFTLQEGDGCTLLAGRNGAGKSTLLNVICGLLEEDGGIVQRDDLMIGYLPFESPLYPHLTILENLRYFYRSFQGKDFDLTKPKIQHILEAMSINYLNQRYDKCSSGQQQKAGIAVILLSGADLIIMDEPFIAMDALSSENLMNIIEEMKKDTMFLITTHTVDKLKDVANRLLFLNGKHLMDTTDRSFMDEYFKDGQLHDEA